MDRRTIWAIFLMMVIAIAPALFLKKPAPSPVTSADSLADSTTKRTPVTPVADTARPALTARDSTPQAPADTGTAAQPAGRPSTVLVTSPLYTYGISTLGGRLVQAELSRYASMAPADSGRRAQIVPENSDLLGLTVVRGRDTVDFRNAVFASSAERL